MVKVKADNPSVADYLATLDSPMKPLLLKLRTVVRGAVRGLDEQIKWGNCLTFAVDGTNIIQTVVGKEKVTLIFFAGVALKDAHGLLEGTGKKVRSARFAGEKFDAAALRDLVRQAAAVVAG